MSWATCGDFFHAQRSTGYPQTPKHFRNDWKTPLVEFHLLENTGINFGYPQT